MIERILRIPLLGSMTAIVLAAVRFLRPIDRSVLLPVRFADDSMGYVNSQGRVVLVGPWVYASPFDAAGFAVASRQGGQAIIDRSGRTVAEGDAIRPFNGCGLATVRRR